MQERTLIFMKKALFLDRDGVIVQMVYDPEYGTIDTVKNEDPIEFVPGIIELLKFAKKKGYLIIMVSNQPDIGLEKISKKKFEQIRQKINQLLKKEGIVFDGEYYCFHHPFAKIEENRQKCECRKPNFGMLTKAATDLNIDLKESFMIGDGVNDIIAGSKAGCGTILLGNIVEAEYLRILEEKLEEVKPDHLVKRLEDITKII